jgi:hypothetical protein
VVEYFQKAPQKTQFQNLKKAIATRGSSISHGFGDAFDCSNISQYENFLSILHSQKLIPGYVQAALVGEITKLNSTNVATQPVCTPTSSKLPSLETAPAITPQSLITDASKIYRNPERDDGTDHMEFTVYIKRGGLTPRQQEVLEKYTVKPPYNLGYKPSPFFGPSFEFIYSSWDYGLELLKELSSLGDDIISPELREKFSKKFNIQL